MRLISKNKLNELTKDSQSHIINVLSYKEFEKEHIPTSINIPHSSESFKEIILDSIEDKNSPIVVYSKDTDCLVAVNAAKDLCNLGYKKVFYYEGGIEEWKKSGKEIIH